MTHHIGLGGLSVLLILFITFPGSQQLPQATVSVVVTDSADLRPTRSEDANAEWCYQDAKCGQSTWPATALLASTSPRSTFQKM